MGRPVYRGENNDYFIFYSSKYQAQTIPSSSSLSLQSGEPGWSVPTSRTPGAS